MNTTTLKSQFQRFGCRILFTLATLSPAVHAQSQQMGPLDGGGGGAYVCRIGGIAQSAELIDLWEARNRPYKWATTHTSAYRLNIPYTNENVDVQIARAMNKLGQADPVWARRVALDLAFVRTHIESLTPDVSIEVPPDALAVYSKTGCPPEGMMYFDADAESLTISKEIFGKLINNTNIAAAYTHEAIYKSLRELNSMVPGNPPITNSTPIRRLNACLYSTDDCLGLAKAVAKLRDKTMKFCTSNSYDVYLKQTSVEEKGVGADRVRQETWTAYAIRIGRAHLTVPLEIDVRFGYGTDLRAPPVPMRGVSYFRNPISYWVKNYSPLTYTETADAPVALDSNLKLKGFDFPSFTVLTTGEVIPQQHLNCI